MAGTATLSTPTFDDSPAWEKVITVVFASGDTAEVKQTVPINGELRRVIVKRSGASGASVTATVAIDDNYDNEIFSQSGMAESGTSKFSVSEIVRGVIDIGVTPSTDPLSAYTVTVYLAGLR